MRDNVDEWLCVSLPAATGCMSGLGINWSLIQWKKMVTRVMEGDEEER